MSDEFLKLARSEIQSEIDNLIDIFRVCTNDDQLYKKSADIEKHMHKIKGLAPMMEQRKVGEIARVSDLVLKYTIKNGTLKGSHILISEAVQTMNLFFNESINISENDFIKKAKTTFPQITGF